MSNMTLARLEALKRRLELLKREAESVVSNARCVVGRGNSVVSFQESIQDVEHFLRSYPIVGTEVDYFINTLVKLNCELEITLSRKSDICNLPRSCENDDSIFYDANFMGTQTSCEACAKEKTTVSTNTDIVTVDKITDYDRESIIKFYDIEEDSILEMKHLQGNNPSQFWLGYYSDHELISHLTQIEKKIQLGELHRATLPPVVGQFIIGFVDSVFRGCVVGVTSGEIAAVDIDSGALKFLNVHDLWDIEDSLSCLPPQAILCKLWSIESIEGWNKCLSTQFRNCLSKCNLVVTVKDVIPGVVPIFVVDVDAHDSAFMDVNMSEWINSFVKPAVEKSKLFDLSNSHLEEAIFQDLDPYLIFGEDNSGSISFASERNVTDRESPEIHSEVKEYVTSSPTNKTVVDSNCTIENLDETPVRDSNQLIISGTGADNGELTMDKVNDDNFSGNSQFISKKQVNDENVSEHIMKPTVQEVSDQLDCQVLTKSSQPVLKSAVVKCFLEKDRTIGMSFLQGNDPWNFFLSYVPLHEIEELKKKVAERAEIRMLTPLSSVPEIGDFAIGKCDDEFCRVRITDVSDELEQNEMNIVVTDIDTGEIKYISMADLWVLEDVFSLPPARAVSCSLWNIPRIPFYWCADLENLFQNVMSRGACNVKVKDVEYITDNWRHIVQIQVFTDCALDVSEWIMNFVFPNLKNIEQCQIRGRDVSDAVSKLDPRRLFSKEESDNNTLQELANEQTSLKSTGKTSVLKSVTSNCESVFEGSPSLPKVKQFLANAILTGDVLSFKTHTRKVESGKKYFVFMSSILSPSEFYVHVISEENSFIDKMHQELSTYCSVSKIYFKNKKEAKQLIPQCCAVRFKDRWLRGRIIDWFDDSSEEVSVFLVDYGLQTTLSFQFVQPLRSDFYEYPVFAHKCALAFISIPPNNDSWPEKSLQAFSNILDYDSVYEIFIVSHQESDNIFNVFLFCDENKNVWCVNDYLVDGGFAATELNKADAKETDNSHTVYYPIIDSGIDETISDSDSNDGHRQSGNEIIHYLDNNTCRYQEVGEELSVVMTEVVNISMFYAVSSKIMYEGRLRNTHEVLMQMNKKIVSAVQSGQLKLCRQLREGTIAVVRYSKDKSWYRARLLASPGDNGYVEVFFVDYGNIDSVHKFYIREITKNFCEIPFQAMRYFVDSIDITKFKEQSAREIAQTLLNGLVDKNEVLIRVTRIVNEDTEVKVFYEGRDIGEEMINLYFAQCS